MMKHLLQLLGIVCLTAGAVLFFITEPTVKETPALADKEKEITRLSQEVNELKETLADDQQSEKTADVESDDTKEETNESNNDDDITETGKEDSIVKMILTLSQGDTSHDVSNSLEQAGIIKSSTEFESYLTDQQLSGKIQIGKHELDSSMDFSALAKELTTVKK